MSQLKIYDLASGTWKYVSSPSQMVTVSDSTPDSPNNGDLWWDTDDTSLLVDTVAPSTLAADTAFTSKYAPISLGHIATTSKTTQQSGITTVTDITSFSVTFTAVAGRRYRITVNALAFSSVTGDVAQLQLTSNDGATVLQLAQVALGTSNMGVSCVILAYITPSAGSVTYKVRLLRNAGTGTLTFDCGAVYPARIVVEDVGT